MAFEPGKSGNPAGRPAGIPNQTTKEAKKAALAFVREYFHNGQAKKDWNGMKGHQRWNIITRLLGLLIPKEAPQVVDISRLTDEEVNEMINQVIEATQE